LLKKSETSTKARLKDFKSMNKVQLEILEHTASIILSQREEELRIYEEINEAEKNKWLRKINEKTYSLKS